MSLPDKDIELAEAYVQNRLSESEREALEARLAGDVALKQEVESQQQLKAAFSLAEAQRLKEELTALEKELRISAPLSSTEAEDRPYWRPGRRWPERWAWIAGLAAAFALIAVSVWFLMLSPDPQAVYLSYYQAYPNTVDPLNRGEAGELSGYQLYEQERYSEALEALAGDNSPQATFYKAQSYLGLGNDDPAFALLEELSQGDSDYRDAARWYCALLLLKQENVEGAEVYLETLASSPSMYQQQAQKVLEELN